ncbi:von Willebrand factor D and EGF domain-containing protein [Mytilus edulis]|uniref:von Willebrand factor D and EGF domain-containing protein n=1 Tax=Mytilus edulis TaxID=6550 RepID=A0A8S3SJT0_MYTED|nr:von Willebrand factor D and EGF domain-containing protein [Mytilus edulis]
MAKISQSWLQGIIFLSSFHFLLCGNFCKRQMNYKYDTCLSGGNGCSASKNYREVYCCAGWEGYTCDVPICKNCKSGETCLGPDNCGCSNKTVEGVCPKFECFPPCQHGGECFGPNKCACRPGYAGDFCDVNPSDIIFVIDESGSVGTANFRVTMEYLANAVNRLPVRYDLLRVGMALFETSARNRFNLDDYHTKKTITDAILKTHFGSGGTAIDRALGFVCGGMFTRESGARTHSHSILVLLTDGQSSEANKPGLATCRSKNVTIIGIGIGGNVNEQQLRSLVSQPEYYFDTTYKNLDTTLPKLLKTITDFCPPGCQNGGTCIARGKCDCPGGYAGNLCQTQVTCSPTCKNNGKCYDTNKCRCQQGFEGSICDIPICNPECKNNGTCSAPDTCVCVNGYSGGLCEVNLEFCRPGCQNGGTCIAKGKCLCPEGYAGNHCQNRVTCNPKCKNGICVDYDKCRCHQGYQGTICGIPICNPECKNNGTCSAPATCECENGYSGGLCEVNLSKYDRQVNVIAGLPKNIVIAIVASKFAM